VWDARVWDARLLQYTTQSADFELSMIGNDASHGAAPEDDVTAALAHNDKSEFFERANDLTLPKHAEEAPLNGHFKRRDE
jgi:hypothetical protein